jgi:hypothetical protein
VHTKRQLVEYFRGVAKGYLAVYWVIPELSEFFERIINILGEGNDYTDNDLEWFVVTHRNVGKIKLAKQQIWEMYSRENFDYLTDNFIQCVKHISIGAGFACDYTGVMGVF